MAKMESLPSLQKIYGYLCLQGLSAHGTVTSPLLSGNSLECEMNLAPVLGSGSPKSTWEIPGNPRQPHPPFVLLA